MKIDHHTWSEDMCAERRRLLDAEIRDAPGIAPADRVALLAELHGDPRAAADAHRTLEARYDTRARAGRFYANVAESTEKWSGIVGIVGGLGVLLAGHPLGALFAVIGLTGGIGWLAEALEHKAREVTIPSADARRLEAQIHSLHL